MHVQLASGEIAATSVAVLEAPEKLVQVEVNIEGSDHFIWFTNGERASFGGKSFEKPACGGLSCNHFFYA